MKCGKRITTLFAALMGGFFLCILGVLTAAFHGEELSQAAARQSTYELAVSRPRGDFYDCKGQKLTGRNQQALAAVAPTIEAAATLTNLVTGEYRTAIASALSNGTPFLARVPFGTESSAGIDVFSVLDRYTEDQPASNLIGYLDGKGNGAAGLERVFNSVLQLDGLLKVTYSVDASDRVVNGVEREISDNREEAEQGVVLTIDRRIQQIAEQACEDILESGAVVVTEVGTGEIKALVSLPSLHPDNIAQDLENPDSPLINKAFASYNVGSVFKLVSAAAALEEGISPEYVYDCTGSIEVDGQKFKCFDGIAHGVVTMEEAIAESCNGYFVSLMQQVDPTVFLETARKLGFGQGTEFTSGFCSDAGTLPNEKSLLVKKALANFSFGQGELTATPIQVAAMTNTIASGGTYRDLSLIKGIVSLEDGTYNFQQPAGEKQTVLSQKTCKLLRAYMTTAVKEGTAASGAPKETTAAAKTGTAQTGRNSEEGEEIVQLWYTGFFPAETPRYTVTVLRAERAGNGRECARVFQKIADEMESQGFLS